MKIGGTLRPQSMEAIQNELAKASKITTSLNLQTNKTQIEEIRTRQSSYWLPFDLDSP